MLVRRMFYWVALTKTQRKSPDETKTAKKMNKIKKILGFDQHAIETESHKPAHTHMPRAYI